MLEWMNNPLFVNCMAGGLGQLTRSLLGVKKAIDEHQDINVKQLVSSIFEGFVVGLFVGIFAPDWRFAFTTGLAATDVTESLIKVIKGG